VELDKESNIIFGELALSVLPDSRDVPSLTTNPKGLPYATPLEQVQEVHRRAVINVLAL